jgi:hypothetical protein
MEDNNRIPWHVLVEGLIAHNKEAFFHALFSAISKHPSYVILSDMEVSRKNEIIDKMIKFYENREDFEKCLVLMNIKKELEIC